MGLTRGASSSTRSRATRQATGTPMTTMSRAILEDRDEYEVENVFWVPPEARWDALLAAGSQPDLGVQLDRALDVIERENPTLRDVLPHVYAGAALSSEKLGKLVSTIAKIGFGADPEQARDMLGRAYEYFIKEFARAEGHRGGEFYTPRTSPGCWSRCSSRTRAGCSTRRAVRAACSSSRREFVAAHGGDRRRVRDLRPGAQPGDLADRQDEPRYPRPVRRRRDDAGRLAARRRPPRPEGRLRDGEPAVQPEEVGRRPGRR